MRYYAAIPLCFLLIVMVVNCSNFGSALPEEQEDNVVVSSRARRRRTSTAVTTSTHHHVRGGIREAPGLEQAIIDYEEAKLLVDEAKLLLKDAEREEEIIKQHEEGQTLAHRPKQHSFQDEDDSSTTSANEEDEEDEEETAAAVVEQEEEEESVDGDDDKQLPSICGRDLLDIEEICAEQRPICRYKTIVNPKSATGYTILTELADNIGQNPYACVRRCDARYGLTEHHCGEGQSCFTQVSNCGDCDELSTEEGDCQYIE